MTVPETARTFALEYSWNVEAAGDFVGPNDTELANLLWRAAAGLRGYADKVGCQHTGGTHNKFSGAIVCDDCSRVIGSWKEPQPRLNMTLEEKP